MVTNANSCFEALGDASRRALFERLAKEPLPVGYLARGLPISRSAVSQHLRILKEARLVVAIRSGTRNVYHVDPRGVAAMRQYLDRFWDRALSSFKNFAEREE